MLFWLDVLIHYNLDNLTCNAIYMYLLNYNVAKHIQIEWFSYKKAIWKIALIIGLVTKNFWWSFLNLVIPRISHDNRSSIWRTTNYQSFCLHTRFNLVLGNYLMLMYPNVLYPMVGITLTSSIFMVVVITYERYSAVYYHVDYRNVSTTTTYLHLVPNYFLIVLTRVWFFLFLW